MLRGRIWTLEEEAYMQRWYGILKPKTIAAHLNRKVKTVHNKAYAMKLSNNEYTKQWHSEKNCVSKVDNVDYEPKELNAPKENWYALLICIRRNYTISKALSVMGISEYGRR